MDKVKLEVEEKEAIKKWLEEGNKVTVCPPNEKTDSDKIVSKNRRRNIKPK